MLDIEQVLVSTGSPEVLTGNGSIAQGRGVAVVTGLLDAEEDEGGGLDQAVDTSIA